MISNRTLQGQPILPYTDNVVWAGQDVFVTLTFVDRTGTPVTPTGLALEIDDLTDAVSMFGPYTLPAVGGTIPATPITSPGFASTMIVQIPASIMVMTYPSRGSQIVQFSWTATAVDSVTGNSFTFKKVDIVSLAAIATVSGS